MAFKYAGMAVACRSHLGIKLATRFSPLQTQVSRVSSQAGDNPHKDDSKSQPRDGGRTKLPDATEAVKEAIKNVDPKRTKLPDATEAVKEAIKNVIDAIEAMGENTKEAAETVRDIVKEGVGAVKDKIKYAGIAPPREDVAAARESAIEEEWRRRLRHNS